MLPVLLCVARALATVGMGLRMDSVNEPDTVGVAWLTAVTVTVLGEGMVAGGVYRPEVEIVPVTVAPPVTPLTCHVTAALALLVTVAVSCTGEPSLA